MHRRPNYELLLLDIEIERTLRSLKKTKCLEEVIMAENQFDKNKEGHPQQ